MSSVELYRVVKPLPVQYILVAVVAVSLRGIGLGVLLYKALQVAAGLLVVHAHNLISPSISSTSLLGVHPPHPTKLLSQDPASTVCRGCVGGCYLHSRPRQSGERLWHPRPTTACPLYPSTPDQHLRPPPVKKHTHTHMRVTGSQRGSPGVRRPRGRRRLQG